MLCRGGAHGEVWSGASAAADKAVRLLPGHRWHAQAAPGVHDALRVARDGRNGCGVRVEPDTRLVREAKCWAACPRTRPPVAMARSGPGWV